MKKIFLLLCFAIFVFQGNAQSVAHNRCANLQKGINLSNWLEAYWLSNWPVPGFYTRDFLAEMKNAGMKSVRLPVCFSLVTDTLPPYTVDTASPVFAIIDSVITWTHELDMNLIIDNHHQFDLTDSTWRSVQPRLAHLWSVLAQRYSYLDPEKYYFEILNEPTNITNDSLNILFTAVIDTIRKYTTTHSLVASPNAWSEGVGYYSYTPLNDTNLIYTFHSYDPFQFTHQGFTWVTPYLNTGRPYPNSGYDFLIPFSWQLATLWRDSFNLPVFLGEFGVGIHPDSVSRCNWIDTVGSLIDYYHMPSFSWDVRGDFALYNSGVISEDSVIPCFSIALHLYGNQAAATENIVGQLPVEIFPNPASNIFTCRTNQQNQTLLEVMDNTGRKMLEKKFSNQSDVNTENWARGLYLVKITSSNSSSVHKVIIQ